MVLSTVSCCDLSLNVVMYHTFNAIGLAVTIELDVQVKELLQHRTGANALAQQGAGGRNAVEVMGLQKVYRASNTRYIPSTPHKHTL